MLKKKLGWSRLEQTNVAKARYLSYVVHASENVGASAGYFKISSKVRAGVFNPNNADDRGNHGWFLAPKKTVNNASATTLKAKKKKRR